MSDPTPTQVQPAPDQWWRQNVGPEDYDAYVAAARAGTLPVQLAEQMSRAGIALVYGAAGTVADPPFPESYRDYVLTWARNR